VVGVLLKKTEKRTIIGSEQGKTKEKTTTTTNRERRKTRTTEECEMDIIQIT
jgi:hypothetical protein